MPDRLLHTEQNDGMTHAEAIEREFALAKEALLRQIGHLRQRVDYDYPPVAVKSDIAMVRAAYWSWRDAAERRLRHKLDKAGSRK